MLRSRSKHNFHHYFLQALESRQLLTVLPSTPHFVLHDTSLTYLGTLRNVHYAIPNDANSSGPEIHTTIDWRDGTIPSDAVLVRDAKGRIQVWGNHDYSTLGSFRLKIISDADGTPLPITIFTTATVQLNANRGRTLRATAGTSFNGTVGTLARLKNLPVITTPSTIIHLPAGANFAQYKLSDTPATATLRIDWGDGTVSDGSVVSQGDHYNVLGDHIYASPGSYRIIINIIIEAPDHTLLHVDMVNSTAHVAAAGAHPRFALPQHTQVSASAILPANTLIPVNNASGGTSGVTGSASLSSGAGSLIVNGVSSGVSAGVLTIGRVPDNLTALTGLATGGWTGQLDITDNNLVIIQSHNTASTATLLSNLVNQISINHTANTWTGTGITSSNIFTGTAGNSTLAIIDNADLGLTSPIGPTLGTISNGDFQTIFAHFGSLSLTSSLNSGLIFGPTLTLTNSNSAFIQLIPSDYHGTIILPDTIDRTTLPNLPNATFLFTGTIVLNPS